MAARPATARKAAPARAKPAKPRRRPVPARREAILAAALAEFSAQGFSAARLDDVARRAGVAKGTIYLYFRDKETLFEELIRSVLSPVVSAIELALRDPRPVREIAETAVEIFVREVLGTPRKDVIRLVISEGGRFPKLAEFYYREVLVHLFTAVQALLRRAAERRELRNAAVVQFPQLMGAPAIVGVIWSGLFDRFEPLDVREFMRAQLDLIFTPPPPNPPPQASPSLPSSNAPSLPSPASGGGKGRGTSGGGIKGEGGGGKGRGKARRS